MTRREEIGCSANSGKSALKIGRRGDEIDSTFFFLRSSARRMWVKRSSCKTVLFKARVLGPLTPLPRALGPSSRRPVSRGPSMGRARRHEIPPPPTSLTTSHLRPGLFVFATYLIRVSRAFRWRTRLSTRPLCALPHYSPARLPFAASPLSSTYQAQLYPHWFQLRLATFFSFLSNLRETFRSPGQPF